MSEIHSNISIFVPHIGCPHQCSFCNQVHITGQNDIPNAESVRKAVETAKSFSNYNPTTTELAFFGGSFTAIETQYRKELLREAYKFVADGSVRGIRISTRPDAIDEEILDNLKMYGVTAIELGAQSMDNEVLLKNQRGHTSETVEAASRLIKEKGFSLGLQMMTGLLGDTDEKALETAKKIAALNPDTVRIYPTVVLKGTYLSRFYNEGKYTPQTVKKAVSLCAEIATVFQQRGIKIIRLGLHSIDESAFVSGPWHPAFGELVESEKYKNSAYNLLKQYPKGKYLLFVNPKEISKLIGQHRCNLKEFSDMGYYCRVKENADLDRYIIEVKEDK